MGARHKNFVKADRVVVVVAALLSSPLASCEMRAPVAEQRAPPEPARAVAPVLPPAPIPLQCGTLRDVDESDVVRVVGDRLYYADEGAGLVALDVEDVDHPREVAASRFVGTPLALHVHEDVVWVVFVDWDGRTLPQRGVATVIRAVSSDDLHVLGEVALPGLARGVSMVGDALYVLRDAGEHGELTSLRVRGGAIGILASVPIDGTPRALVASAAGLAAIASSSGTAVTWVDLPLDTPGALEVQGTSRVEGSLAAGRAADADEDRRVRLVTCGGAACSVHVVDFSGDVATPLGSRAVTERPAVPVTRFANDTLYVAEPSARGGVTTTDLRVVRLDDPRAPRVVAKVPLRGSVRALAVRGGHLLALGTVGSPEIAVRLAIHDVDVREPASPRLRGAVTFGSDWTWSVAEGADRAVSYDPATSLVAIPFTALLAPEQRYEKGTQLVALGEDGPRLGPAHASEGLVERAVFLRGRLLTIGPSGVRAIDYADNRGSLLIR